MNLAGCTECGGMSVATTDKDVAEREDETEYTETTTFNRTSAPPACLFPANPPKSLVLDANRRDWALNW